MSICRVLFRILSLGGKPFIEASLQFRGAVRVLELPGHVVSVS